MPSWLPLWSSEPSNPTGSNSNTSRQVDDNHDLIAALDAKASSVPPHLLILSAFVVGSATALAANYVYVRHVKRIPNAEWVTPEMLTKRRWVKGYVTSVGDADNFRLYHTPGIGWRWPFKFRRIPVGRSDLKDQTIHIRIAGVDAPETGHFGRPAQPFSGESLTWLKSQVEGKFVYCQLVRRDQFGRIVSAVHLKPRLFPGWLATGKDLSLEMLRAGWASVYEQAGAEYGRSGLEEFLRVQKEAQRAKRGMWKYGTQGETPAEYKKRYRDAAATGDAVAPEPKPAAGASSSNDSQTSPGWFSRLLRTITRK
ncbi:SNase-domain-containing protein [Trametes coccinea BRFM310]|uniref:SNase-domain-containing protein n=1 Tax=Trametes coccinea (strain BRFM310) TaxID=1353009 RepID=A0A1Y2IUG2_TRAC3|nr:SNase-domain-containing protein [Trametes coccinea BRFM310]